VFSTTCSATTPLPTTASGPSPDLLLRRAVSFGYTATSEQSRVQVSKNEPTSLTADHWSDNDPAHGVGRLMLAYGDSPPGTGRFAPPAFENGPLHGFLQGDVSQQQRSKR
jgi:hypothetical protein